MKKVVVGVLFVLLGLALAGPTIAHARTVSAQSEAQKKAQKKTQKNWKSYSKQAHKQQKKQLKAQKRATKNWKKAHPTTTTVI